MLHELSIFCVINYYLSFCKLIPKCVLNLFITLLYSINHKVNVNNKRHYLND